MVLKDEEEFSRNWNVISRKRQLHLEKPKFMKQRGVIRQVHLMYDWCRTGNWGGQIENRTAESSRAITVCP